MKKILAVLSILLFFANSSFAIEWIDVKSASGNQFALDKDSIKEIDGYYFYNIKYYTNGLDDIVITMQAKKTHPFCARINHYKLSNYISLKGDYKNIANNKTQKLEPVTYNSRAYASYKKVKEIMDVENKPRITF